MYHTRPVLTLRVVMSKHCIHHFHTDHIAPCLAPKILFNIFLDFSWDDCNTKDKLGTMLMQFFLAKRKGVNKVRNTCSLYHTDHIAPCLDPQILFNVFFRFLLGRL